MFPDGVLTATVEGSFLDDHGRPIENFLLKLQGSREGITIPNHYIDLGPQYFVLDSEGRLKPRKSDGPIVIVANYLPDQQFHYVAEISGCKLPVMNGIIRADPYSVIDLPKELLQQIPEDELPEWAAILQQVLDARDEVIDIAEKFESGEYLDDAIKEYLENNPLEGVTEERLNFVLDQHINDPEPHPAYDQQIPNLTLLFENQIV